MTEGDQEQAGKAAVKALLVDRLASAGLSRPRGTTQIAHDAMMARLVDYFAYMAPDNLETLAEVIIDHAQGGVCPSEVLIRQWGKALQDKPLTEARIISSWLASVEGPIAEAQGRLVELYRFLCRHRRMPLAMDTRQIADDSADNARRRELIADRIARDVARPEDRDWLAAWERDQRTARDIVEQGKRARAERDKGQSGGQAA